MKRLYNLDYLRGISAFGIMIYHYLSWITGGYSADSFIERVGTYGVSIFYILSGLTLYYVYYNKLLPSVNSVYQFLKKRAFRIFPLLWLATLASLILKHQRPELMDILLNLTGLFGIFKWDKYFATGAWSIGNELVFYLFLPFFIFLTKSYKKTMIVLTLIIVFLFLYFSFNILDPNVILSHQWKDYINPLNQILFFLGGFLLGMKFQEKQIHNRINLLILLMGLIIFIFYPASGDRINIVTGVNRLVFTTSCFLICFGFYKLTIKIPNYIHYPLTFLGEASYSVYLLHPIVYIVTGYIVKLFNRHFFVISDDVKILLSIISTLIISYFVYIYFEKYFMRKSDTKTNRKKVFDLKPERSQERNK